ncbi:DUF1643 domain-containing protein [Siminovitchia terrae]|uniref:DUF1643 domain-containing protein n=1 Tax=Siminovitchia terrae TaxID=1914933 RepID=A0A429X9X3_SIMTE|nr:DUF1643 domain-containing protein [Siminovitchia terrae]RST60228.1 DUF1643 domain-containing protein [Siminovitchia terrae]
MDNSTIKLSHVIETQAIFSECKKYRYSLTRKVTTLKGKITFIMFNPNIRDDIQLGSTSNYCFNYTLDNKYGAMEIVNLFALRTRSIKELKECVRNNDIDPVGDLNNWYIENAIKDADKVILAWGAAGGFQRRDKYVLNLLKETPLYCFDTTIQGKPEYPKRKKDYSHRRFYNSIYGEERGRGVLNEDLVNWILKTELKDWLQLISVIIATVAAIASWKAVNLTVKQYKLNEKQKAIKIKPIFRIRGISRQTNGFFLDLESKGHPFYHIKDVTFTGSGVEIERYFNGEVGTDKSSALDSFAIVVRITKDATTEGAIHITGMDIEGNKFEIKTPVIKIKEGKLENGIDIHKQYLIDV